VTPTAGGHFPPPCCSSPCAPDTMGHNGQGGQPTARSGPGSAVISGRQQRTAGVSVCSLGSGGGCRGNYPTGLLRGGLSKGLQRTAPAALPCSLLQSNGGQRGTVLCARGKSQPTANSRVLDHSQRVRQGRWPIPYSKALQALPRMHSATCSWWTSPLVTRDTNRLQAGTSAPATT
jgi:hypothetical protein